MDVDGPVTSPSFVLARVHRARRNGSPAMVHVDLYRRPTTPAPTCSANSTHSTWTPTSTTPSWSSNGARASSSASPSATSTSDWNVRRRPMRAPRPGDGADHDQRRARHRHRDTRRHRGTRAARRRLHRRARRTGDRRRPCARRAADPERGCRAADARDRGDRPGHGGGGLRARAVHWSAGRDGHRRRLRPGAGIPVYGVCSLDAIGIDTAGEVLVVTDARRREVYWARYRDGLRIDGPAVNAPADVPIEVSAVAGSPEHAAMFALPRQPASIRRRRAWCGDRLAGAAAAARAALPTPARRQATARRWPAMTDTYDGLAPR